MSLKEDLEKLFVWGPPEERKTSDGLKMARHAIIPKGTTASDTFWLLWRNHKQTVKDIGIEIKKDDYDVWHAYWSAVTQEDIDAINTALEDSVKLETDFVPPKPEGLVYNYFMYQNSGVEFGLKRKNVLIADAPRLGKTIQAIGIMNSLDSDVIRQDMIDGKITNALILTPSTVKIGWTREFAKWSTKKLTVGRAKGNKLPDTDVVVINYDLLSRHAETLLSKEWDVIVADEVHYLKNPKTARAQVGLNLRGKRIIALSGTPLHKYKDLYHVLHWLDPINWPDEKSFKRLYVWPWLYDGIDTTDKLQRKLRSTIMIRRSKKEVWKDLPDKLHQTVVLPAELTGKMKQVLEREKQFYLKLYGSKADRISEVLRSSEGTKELESALASLKSNNAYEFGEIAKIRREVGMEKIEHTIEYIHSLIDENPEYKVVAFAYHRDVIDALVEHFGKKCVRLYGGMTETQKQNSIDRFRDDPEVQIFFGQLESAGQGISLAASDHIIYIELDWRPLIMEQTVDRCDHFDKTSTVFIQYLVFENSIDERISEVLVETSEMIRKTLDSTESDIDRLKLQPIANIELNIEAMVKKSEAEKRKTYEDVGLTGEAVQAIHFCIRLLDGVCDGASTKDNMGFNGGDTSFGKDLARRETLTPNQAAAAKLMLRKYRNQLPQDLYDQIYGGKVNVN